VVVPFTKQFSEIPAENYIREFLANKFHPHTIIIGYDHHFGNERKGNYKLLEAHAGEFNFTVKEIPEHVLNHVTISSTKIRNAILVSDIGTANKYLGYDFNTVELAVRDNVPYAIDFCNPAPDAERSSVGEENFAWVVETAANYAIEKAMEQKDGQDNLTWGEYVKRGANKQSLV